MQCVHTTQQATHTWLDVGYGVVKYLSIPAAMQFQVGVTGGGCRRLVACPI